jgi:hypothetical protein
MHLMNLAFVIMYFYEIALARLTNTAPVSLNIARQLLDLAQKLHDK